MTALHSDLSADLGCWRDASTNADPPVSVRIEESRHIQTLCWCPGVIVIFRQFSLHIFYKQPERIRPIWKVLQCDFYMLAEMRGMDVN